MEALEATVRVIEALASAGPGGGYLSVLVGAGDAAAKLDHFRQVFPRVFEVIHDAARDASVQDMGDRS